MKTIARTTFVWLGVTVLGLMAATLLLAGPDDCAKADLYYQHASKELKKTGEAEFAFRKAIQLCPSHAKARVKLAEVLAKMKKSDEAEQEFQAALKTDASLVDARTGLGTLYATQGRYEMAKTQFEAALKLKPTDQAIKSCLDDMENKIKGETGGFKKAQDIVSRVTKPTQTSDSLKLMGFQDYTEAKDRIRFNNILFDEWSYLIREQSTGQLNEIGKALQTKSMEQFRVVVEGHTDSRGDPQRNDRLSKDRADAVRKYLVERVGIDPNKIEAQGHGFSKPRFPNDSEQNMRENRRVEIVFFD